MRRAEPAAAPKDSNEAVNHRTIVGHQRRAKTEAKIIEAALGVFAEKGRDAPVIDDFIKAAGIARGTFYNHFKSVSELLEATSTWLTDDLVESIEPEINPIEDPVLRHATGLRLWMKKAETDAAWCGFVATFWFRGGFGRKEPLNDIKAGIKSGDFTCTDSNVAFDMVMGTIRQGMTRLMEDPKLRSRKGYGDKIVRVILQGLGVNPAKIEEVLARPLPDLRRPTRSVS
ncbi:MAG TPA: TetR/AcrR family transcriptional regulator [Noviherbaspirillum sp.]|uniref:TetR/AcrR family transcriptional regulator n=1 Tax=Noviherbaspirillum sp. TaxID=1926288 RepID=UPI002B48BF0C|nr:TetR/AcrR family transcriptional regulator [Noviherbaspirillum sp.]HJV84562.1 TetR/AcrR family transcriptional regulator [Noviherbaspirillum sp.]